MKLILERDNVRNNDLATMRRQLGRPGLDGTIQVVSPSGS